MEGKKRKHGEIGKRGDKDRILLPFALSTKGEEKAETKKTRDNKKID